MSEIQTPEPEQTKPSQNPNRTYFIVAAVLLVVIVVTSVLLIKHGIPALLGTKEPTAAAIEEPAATQVPTFTPQPTTESADTPLPTTAPTFPPLTMSDTEAPLFAYQSAGARPGADWTGFFGQVLDAVGAPMEGVPVIVWYRDGQPASSPTRTDQSGSYEIVLADAPLAGLWTIQVLTAEGNPASKLLSFETNEDTEAGIQQIQVVWQQIP